MPTSTPESDVIEFFDAAGRLVRAPRERFATELLPDRLRRHADQPDALYTDVVFARQNGLASAVLPAARRLQQIDLNRPERGALALAAVLLDLHRFADARAILEHFIHLHGERGAILVELSRSLTGQGETDEAHRLLRKALALDPNQSDGLALYADWHRRQFGPPGYRAALEEISEEPRAWRPQLMLAHELLEPDPAAALELFSQATSNMNPPDAGARAMIAGDLLRAGHAEAVVELIRPGYDPQRDAPRTAVHLVAALRQLGRDGEANTFVDSAVRQRPELAALLRPVV